MSCAIGRSYLPDATAEHEAIAVEPLFRRPCQASVGDNPFATAYPYIDTTWNAMNALAVVAREVGGVDRLHARITEWHTNTGTEYPQLNPMWCADACVLIFGAIYPQDHAVAKQVVPECYSRALPFTAKAARLFENENSGAYPLLEHCFPGKEELLVQGRALWARFSTRPANQCPWKVAIAPMLSLILRKQGSHDNTLEEIGEFRNCLNALCSKGAWLAYSEDGVKPPKAPNPAAGCATMHDVRRPSLDPVFVAQGDSLDIVPRGCLVGLVPFQLRQLYSLMAGAHLEHVDQVQCVRNEGTCPECYGFTACTRSEHLAFSCAQEDCYCARALFPPFSSRMAKSGRPRRSRRRRQRATERLTAAGRPRSTARVCKSKHGTRMPG